MIIFLLILIKIYNKIILKIYIKLKLYYINVKNKNYINKIRTLIILDTH